MACSSSGKPSASSGGPLVESGLELLQHAGVVQHARIAAEVEDHVGLRLDGTSVAAGYEQKSAPGSAAYGFQEAAPARTRTL